MTERVWQTIYIAGFGRSGSTVLGTLLGAHHTAVHVGEISFLFEDLLLEGRACSCGASYETCPFWAAVLGGRGGSFQSEKARLTRTVERVSGVPRLLTGGGRGDRSARYGALHRDLLDRVRERAGAEVVIDSSKSAWSTIGRFLALEQYASQRVKVIHLIRSGRSTMRSLLNTGSNWEIEGRTGRRPAPIIRAATGWTAVNYFTTRLAAELPPERYLAIRYEDLISRPGETLRRIGGFTNLDFGAVIDGVERADGFATGHVAGGNRLRFEPAIKLAPPSGRSSGAEQASSESGGAFFGAVGGWLERRYGY